jgi:hypothetical protein
VALLKFRGAIHLTWLEIKEGTIGFLSRASSRFSTFFVWTEVASSVYFVFVSAIPSSKVIDALRQIGFRDEISNNIYSVIYSIWTIVVVAVLLLISRVTSRLRNRGIEKLKVQLEYEKSQNAVLSETLASLTPSLRSFYGFTLESILRKLNLDDSPKVRISAYILSSDTAYFTPVGRFSHNALYRTQGRTLLPFSEGCISDAWKVGKCVWRQMSMSDDVRKRKSLDTYQIPEDTFDGFRMKSVTLGAYRIDDNSQSPVGLVVIEAVEHNVIDFDAFSSVLNDEKVNLQRLISSTQQYLTDPALALEADV